MAILMILLGILPFVKSLLSDSMRAIAKRIIVFCQTFVSNASVTADFLFGEIEELGHHRVHDEIEDASDEDRHGGELSG